VSESRFDVDHDAFITEVYQLLAAFLASRPIAGLPDAGANLTPVTTLALFPQRGFIPNRLIAVASLIRAKSDDGSWWHVNPVVGQLWEPFPGVDASIPLTFREACNKVMHATKVNYDTDRHPDTGVEYLNTKLHLYGSRAGSEWKAVFDVIEFCRAARGIVF
jgi:hypothetical protein